jgi:molybdate transport system ATP-binding protein
MAVAVVPTTARQVGRPAINCENLAKVYFAKGRETWAIGDVSLRIQPGEFVSIVGPSGCGKSTLLNIIAGFLPPSSGMVGVNGTPVQGIPEGLGYIFQKDTVLPWYTVRQNIGVGMSFRRASRSEIATKTESLLALANLSSFSEHYPYQLSGGMRRRVNLLMSLACDPKVLLLDEPFGALDTHTKTHLHQVLIEIWRKLGQTIVLVTHDLDEAAMLADRMCILHRGRTLQIGTPQEVMTKPADALVARLVDLRNVFEAVVRAHDAPTGCTLLEWQGLVLEVAHAPAFDAGTRVSWTIPVSGIVLHRRDRPSRGEHENPVFGIVSECLALGDDTTIGIRIADTHDALITLRVPTHVARRNAMAVGVRAGVSLLADAIHVMPWRDTGREGAPQEP